MRRVVVPLVAAFPFLVSACTGGSTTVEQGTAPTGSEPALPRVTGVTFDAGLSIQDPHIALDGDGGVHLFWWDNTEPDGVVRHAVVQDGTIGAAEPVSDAMDVFTSETTVLTSPSGEVCAFFDGWLDEQDLSTRGYYQRCLSAAGWSAPELVTSQSVTSTFDPAFDGSGKAIAVATTPISSVTFEGQELSGSDLATAQAQLVVDTAGVAHVLWAELGTDEFAVLHRTSSDGGATWSPIEALAGTGFFVPEPELNAATDGSVHVFYSAAELFHRVWTADAGWGDIVAGPECGIDSAFALGPDDEPVAACASFDGVALTAEHDGVWSPLAPIEGSQGVAAFAISLAVSSDGTRHVAWVNSADPPELHYATVPG